MKRNQIVCTIAGLLTTVAAQAQIPNSGFEIMNADNHISQWGKALLMAVIIDSNGNTYSDSIVFDNNLYFATPEAHSGQQAMEMRNGYNYTAGQGISGGSFLSSDDSYSTGFQQLVEIGPIMPPERLNFWYQYIPLGTDTATVLLTMYDVDGNLIGEAAASFGETTNGYTLADIPIVYAQPAEITYITMSFSTSSPGGTITFGTRFLVDDVSLEGLLGTEEEMLSSVEIYPNPATDYLEIKSPEAIEQVTVISIAGQRIPAELNGNTIDCSEWSPGTYFIHTLTAGRTFSEKITITP